MDERQLHDNGNRAACKLLNMVRGITKKIFLCSAIPALVLLVLAWMLSGFDFSNFLLDLENREPASALVLVLFLLLLCVALISGEQLLILKLLQRKLDSFGISE